MNNLQWKRLIADTGIVALSARGASVEEDDLPRWYCAQFKVWTTKYDMKIMPKIIVLCVWAFVRVSD